MIQTMKMDMKNNWNQLIVSHEASVNQQVNKSELFSNEP